MNLYIDIGGTNFRYQIDDSFVKSKKTKDVDMIKDIDTIIKKYPDIKNISISFAGQVLDGVIIDSPNIDLKNLEIKSYIESKYDIKLYIDNDLNCAALAEHQNIKSDNLAVFYIGTGFGSAFIDNGILIKGATNRSAEIGHIPFKKSPLKCGCGRDDCVELFCSGDAIIKWCDYFNIKSKYAQIDKLQNHNSNESRIIIDNFYDALSHTFHTALSLFDFDTLVLGGSVGKNRFIKEFLEQELQKTRFNKNDINIVTSKLENGSLEGTKRNITNFTSSV